MAETRRKFDRDFKEGAVRRVLERGRPIAEVARDLGINEGTLGTWVNADRRRRGDGNGALGEDERAELARLRRRTPSWRWSVFSELGHSVRKWRNRTSGSPFSRSMADTQRATDARR